MSAEFKGLVAVVTGGSSGIGAAVATQLRTSGALVAVLDVSMAEPEDGQLSVHADISDDRSVRAAIAAVIAEYGRIDILVNNAGIGAQGTVEDNDDEEWMHVMDVNVLGMVRVSRAALPLPAIVAQRRDCQHVFDRCDRRASAASTVFRE